MVLPQTSKLRMIRLYGHVITTLFIPAGTSVAVVLQGWGNCESLGEVTMILPDFVLMGQ
jgi:hypothetical protein